MNLLDLKDVKQQYSEGKNITSYLRKKFNEDVNTPEIIEIAYDLQAGSYAKYATENHDFFLRYTEQLAQVFNEVMTENATLLDVGTGELTTLTYILNALKRNPKRILGLDISWSRLFVGRQFFNTNVTKTDLDISLFTADMNCLPLPDKSIDFVTSNHALEPNGKNLAALMRELFRITKNKLILFEPSYEINSEEGKKRMDELGYIKDVDGVVNNLGGKLIDFIPLEYSANPLNPTACYIIEPPRNEGVSDNGQLTFSVPGTNHLLKRHDSFFVSEATGLAYPVLEGVPLLKEKNSILATALFRA